MGNMVREGKSTIPPYTKIAMAQGKFQLRLTKANGNISNGTPTKHDVLTLMLTEECAVPTSPGMKARQLIRETISRYTLVYIKNGDSNVVSKNTGIAALAKGETIKNIGNK
jgi:hypothetical protein